MSGTRVRPFLTCTWQTEADVLLDLPRISSAKWSFICVHLYVIPPREVSVNDLVRTRRKVPRGHQHLLSGLPLEHSTDTGVDHPLTSVEQKRVQEREATRESIGEERFWNKRSDVILLKNLRKRRGGKGSLFPFILATCISMRTVTTIVVSDDYFQKSIKCKGSFG